MEYDILDWLSKIAVVGFVGLAWWNTRATLGRIMKRIDMVVKDHTSCQIDLPKTYVTKDESKDMWGHIDNVASRVSFLEGKHNGT